MSRYQHVVLAPITREELNAGLATLGLVGIWADPTVGLMLSGSLECAGEPVDLRLPAGTLGAIADLGFILDVAGRPALVCGELDRTLLERRLLAPLAEAIAVARASDLAAGADLELDTRIEADGTRRLLLRPRR